MSAIRNILFDYGNVLWNLDIPASMEQFESYWKENLPREETWKYLNKAIAKYERGAISTTLFINYLLKVTTGRTQAHHIIQCWNRMMLDFSPDKLELLDQLKQDYRLFMLSNINDLHLVYTTRFLKEEYGINDFEERYFEQVFYSNEIGLRKPEAESFQFVCNQAGIQPEETLFIDDLEVNTNAAALLGFQIHTLLPGENLSAIIYERTKISNET